MDYAKYRYMNLLMDKLCIYAIAICDVPSTHATWCQQFQTVGSMDGLRRPVASPRGDYTQSVRGQAVHFFCQLVATVIATGKVWKLVGIAEAHMRRTHARAGAIGVCDVPSTHPCHLVSTLLHAGAHILEAHMPERTYRGRKCRGAHAGAVEQKKTLQILFVVRPMEVVWYMFQALNFHNNFLLYTPTGLFTLSHVLTGECVNNLEVQAEKVGLLVKHLKQRFISVAYSSITQFLQRYSSNPRLLIACIVER
jgi:hypothetical protein